MTKLDAVDLQQENDELYKEIDRLEQQVSDLQDEAALDLQPLRDRISSLESNCTRLENSLRAANAKLEERKSRKSKTRYQLFNMLSFAAACGLIVGLTFGLFI